MPATPAWPPESAPRLFVTTTLLQGARVPIEGNQAHYLLNVMRLKVDDGVLLFDGHSGEWYATVHEARKRDALLVVEKQTKPPETVPDFWLCAAPIKKARMEWLMEKATELGVAEIHPVLTRRSVVDKINPDRLTSQMVEAAEQCGRTSLPRLHVAKSFKQFIADFPTDRTLFFADEEGGAPLAQAIALNPGAAALLIGPEGGFDNVERDSVNQHSRTVPVSLGPRILRAETAAIAATSVWMALAGQ